MNTFKLLKSEKGFTLIELIVVIAILGVLSAIMIPSMNGYIQDSKVARATANARTLYSAAMAANATYPLTGDVGNSKSFIDTENWNPAATSLFETKLKSLLGSGFKGLIYIVNGIGNSNGQVIQVQWKDTDDSIVIGEAP